MKQFQTVYREKAAFQETVSEWKARLGAGAVLIHLFSDGAEESDIAEACAVIDEIIPEAAYVGSSASGCIYDGSVSAEKLVVSCMLFEKPDSFAQVCFFPVDSEDVSSFRLSVRETLQRITNVKAIEVIATAFS